MKARDLVIAILGALVLVLVSIPYLFGHDYWMESTILWIIYFSNWYSYCYIYNFLFLTVTQWLTGEGREEERGGGGDRMIDLQESKRRRVALWVFGGTMLLMVLWLSTASFAKSSRQRPAPETISFQGQTAVDGKRVFQAYNCMDCHTLVGNGAYFAPDLTAISSGNGPAWLLAFLSPPPGCAVQDVAHPGDGG